MKATMYNMDAILAVKWIDFDNGYAITAAYPEEYRNCPEESVRAICNLGYFGPGLWADALGGLIAAGCLDADVM